MTDIKTTYRAFVAVTPGLETLLAEEFAELGLGRKLRRRNGGVELSLEQSQMWQLVHASRLAESVRVRIGRFKAHNFDELLGGLRRCPWPAYLRPDGGLKVRVTTRKSALYHSGAVEERVGVVLEKYAADQSEDQQDDTVATVFLRLVKDEVTVSVSASGELLHRRGYRLHVGAAPLRETLAAACVRAARLPDGVVVWDPFCGSGTVVIEALLSSQLGSVAPTRRYAFEKWPTHDAASYASFVESLPQRSTVNARGFGSDIEAKEVVAAERNARAAGLQSATQFHREDFEDGALVIPRDVAVVTNLPYGLRTKTKRAPEALYRRFGRLLSSRADLDPVVVLSGHAGFVAASGLDWKSLYRFTNRGLPVELLRLERSPRE